MLDQVNDRTVTLTAGAARAIQEILTQRNLSGYALRVYVAGQSCCGAQFAMVLDNQSRPDDTTFETDGVRLVVDALSLEYLRGGSVDFVDDPQRGKGFLVNAPNAGQHAEDECGDGCGGGCSCGH